MKIPEPTMPPITIMVASKNPSWRRSWGAGKLHNVTRRKASRGPSTSPRPPLQLGFSPPVSSRAHSSTKGCVQSLRYNPKSRFAAGRSKEI
jgi:hypothetical protein